MLLYLQVMLHFTDGSIVVLFLPSCKLRVKCQIHRDQFLHLLVKISFFYPVIQFILTNTFMWYSSVTITDFHYMIIVDNSNDMTMIALKKKQKNNSPYVNI